MRTENGMETAMRKEIDELSRMTVGQLRKKYLEAFGEDLQIELGLAHRWLVSFGAAGGANNHVSGLAAEPSEPRD